MPPRVRFKIWVEDDDGVILSEWRVRLLEAVEETGSLAKAAAVVGVPYRTAWERVREIEAALGETMLVSESGGATGGGSRLTPAGLDLVNRFRQVNAGIEELVRQRFDDELRERLG